MSCLDLFFYRELHVCGLCLAALEWISDYELEQAPQRED